MLGCTAVLQWRVENTRLFSLVTCSPAPDEVGTDSWSLLRVGRLFPLTLVGICVEAAEQAWVCGPGVSAQWIENP